MPTTVRTVALTENSPETAYHGLLMGLRCNDYVMVRDDPGRIRIAPGM